MASSISDIVEGDLVRSEDGIRHTRVFLVEGLQGNGPARLKNALETSGIPLDREPHPAIAGIRAIDTRVELVNRDPSVAKVTVTYGVPAGGSSGEEGGTGLVEFSTETLSEEVTNDINGRAIETKYLSGAASVTTQRHTVEVQRPAPVVTLRRVESTLPRANQIRFTGTVNSAPWSGFRAGTWFCRGINATENDQGKYDVSYVFIYSEDWRVEVKYQTGGFVPSDVPVVIDSTTGVLIRNGVSLWPVYRLEDFNIIGVRF